MTFNEFVEKIKNEVSIGYNDSRFERPMPRPQAHKIEPGDFLFISWRTGGEGGGSCWGFDSRPISGDEQPNFDSLDRVIELIKPDIKFLEYKRLISGLEQQDDYTESEYYGNYTCYAVKKVVLRDLYERMREMGMFDGE